MCFQSVSDGFYYLGVSFSGFLFGKDANPVHQAGVINMPAVRDRNRHPPPPQLTLAVTWWLSRTFLASCETLLASLHLSAASNVGSVFSEKAPLVAAAAAAASAL